MRRWILAAGLALVLVAPAGARASKVEIALYDWRDPSVKYLRYSAEPGEQNRVTVAALDQKRSAFRVVDEGAVLTTGTGCTRVSEHEATCRGLDWADLQLGDLNDSVRVRTNLASVVKAGPGDDTVVTAGGPDTLDGGGGSDILTAGGKDDSVTDGDNPITGIGPDTIDGGPGHDRVDYANREAPVSVDLGVAGPQGEPGEGDSVTGFEDAGVASSGDRLIGTGGPNLLQAFGSHAIVRGRGGNDMLEAEWEGPDVLAGGPGNDSLRLSTMFVDNDVKLVPDKISCGSGRDLVTFPTEDQFVPLDCEIVDFDSFEDPIFALRGELKATDSQVVKIIAQGCAQSEVHHGRCRLSWAIRERAPSGGTRGPLLAHRVQRFPKDAEQSRVALELTPAGRRILGRRHGLDARIGNLSGNRIAGGFVMRLQLAGKP
jgi:hypothetical protein